MVGSDKLKRLPDAIDHFSKRFFAVGGERNVHGNRMATPISDGIQMRYSG
jgi:hypothetical protein